jgi:hypothetical protein
VEIILPSEMLHNCFKLPAVFGFIAASKPLNPVWPGLFRYVVQSPADAARTGLAGFRTFTASKEPNIHTMNKRARAGYRRFVCIFYDTFLFAS